MSIFCKELNENFETKDEMFLALKNNIKDVVSKKLEVIKHCDGVKVSVANKADEPILSALKRLQNKAFNPVQRKSTDYTKIDNLPRLKVTATSSTSNWFDSHRDVHIDGFAKQTLSLNGQNAFPHIQEHDYDFENVISDGSEVKTYIEKTTFKKLGFDYDGSTEALKFESTIDPNRNIFMYNQYANGWVKNHSVGMRYVAGKIVFCANSEMVDMQEEKANFDKYYPQIANKSDVDEVGYFWAILEIKLIEHSAVVFGSNSITPTDSVEIEAEKSLDNKQADETLQTKNKKKSNVFIKL